MMKELRKRKHSYEHQILIQIIVNAQAILETKLKTQFIIRYNNDERVKEKKTQL